MVLLLLVLGMVVFTNILAGIIIRIIKPLFLTEVLVSNLTLSDIGHSL